VIGNINQFSYNGKRSYDDMNLIITDTPSRASPARRVTYTAVDGRNGDILNDEGCFDNGEVKYKVTAIAEDFEMPLLAKKIKRWLQGEAGYFVLTDTYDPNYFYLACYSGKIDIVDKFGKLGAATLTFKTKPFKFSFDGQRKIAITETATIYNPEDWEASPYIKIVGRGDITLSINNASFAFTGVDNYIEIDSDIQSCFKGTELRNNKANFIKFPKLSEGENNISFTGAVSEIIIMPRWCAL
jgi:predicted phage tail component-like protein